MLLSFVDVYAPQNVLAVILGTALKVLSNYTNHVAEMELDDTFTFRR